MPSSALSVNSSGAECLRRCRITAGLESSQLLRAVRLFALFSLSPSSQVLLQQMHRLVEDSFWFARLQMRRMRPDGRRRANKWPHKNAGEWCMLMPTRCRLLVVLHMTHAISTPSESSGDPLLQQGFDLEPLLVTSQAGL